MFKKKFAKKYKKSATPYSADYSNAIYLLIVESPSKTRKIEEYLGDEFRCIASRGHIRVIEGLKSIKTKDQYQIEFQIDESKADHVADMRDAISHFLPENIYLASDDDREGEAIAWHICDVFGLCPAKTKRILFHEITRPAILAAVQAPQTINMALVHAQQTRQILDMMMGYKISPFLWKHIYNAKTNSLSAGRCQTPALRLVYDNDANSSKELEIRYRIRGTFTPKSVVFELGATFSGEGEIREFLGKTPDFSHKVSVGETKPVVSQPPKPLTTSRLLQSANNQLHYSPHTTMELAQQLYQMGLITYMRTDASTYSPVFLKSTAEYIEKTYEKKEYVGDLGKLQNADAANPHEAIRITAVAMDHITDENKQLCSLYKLIWRNTVESCMSPAKSNQTKVQLTAPMEHKYIHTIDVPVFMGWKRVAESPDTSAAVATGLLFYFQTMSPTSAVPYQKIESVVSATGKHSHYTESSLIQKLEELGIGRPSTYATILATIQDRGYVKRMDIEGHTIQCAEFMLKPGGQIQQTVVSKTFGQEKNKLVLQPIGKLAVEFLVQHFGTLFAYDYTRDMETQLDRIAELSPELCLDEKVQVCKKCSVDIKRLASRTEGLAKQTFPLDDNYELFFTPYGPSLRRINDSGEMEYKAVRKDMTIDMDKLKSGDYVAIDLMEIPNEMLGEYEGEPVLLKSGKYGAYMEWNGETMNLKAVEKPTNKITIDDVLPILISKHKMLGDSGNAEGGLGDISDKYSTDKYASAETERPRNPDILRELTPFLNVRRGKFGPYVYYKKPNMKSPQFISLKTFKQGFNTCDKEVLLDWLKTNHNVDVSSG